jgi:aldehyde dehydrogenase (NAD+)
VGGKWLETGHITEDLNPASPSAVVARVHAATAEVVEDAAHEARAALAAWSRLPAPSRAEYLDRAAGLIAERAKTIAADLTREEGKTIGEATAEVARAVAILRYFAARAFDPIGEVYASANPATRIQTLRQPLGVVSVITPWNFPIAIPAWKIAPALVFGNTVVFKPASATPLTAHHLVTAFVDADVPPGVLNVVYASGGDAGPILGRAPTVDALTFTGSADVGRPLQQRAVESGAKVQLELGGKNAVIVCPDADIELAAQAIARGAFASAGQKCTATSRVIAVGTAGAGLRDALSRLARGLNAGDPLDPSTTHSPVIDRAAQERITGIVDAAHSHGAQIIARGDVPTSGWFVPPIVLDHVDPRSPVAQEEIFGPVVVLLDAADLDEALEIHNSVRYGLAGSIFTSDIATADKFARAARAGVVHINGETPGAEPHVPFGGMGESSSWSREQGPAAEQFFTQTKTIYTDMAPIVGLFDF